jgi:hypothetical protein
MDDLYIHNEGSVFLLYALTNASLDWVAEHIPEDAQKFGVAFVVEHRFIRNVVAARCAMV